MKIKIITFFLALVAGTGTMFAEKVKIGDLFYNLDASNLTAEVTFSLGVYSGLTTVNIPSSVTYNSVTYSVTSIGDYAFSDCTSLTSVTIPNSVSSIGYEAFYNCDALGSVSIPNSVLDVGIEAFSDCGALTSVTLSNNITEIKDYTFAYCHALTSISIPNSIISIGASAFADCYVLTAVTLGTGIKTIEHDAFYQCGLTSVIIPANVTSIGNEAFAENESLTDVYVSWNIPIGVNTSVFDGVSKSSCTLHVPCGCLAAYQVADVWKDFGTIVEMPCTTFTITWKNYDGTTLKTEQVNNGQTPAYTGATPTKPATAEYTYTFAGWSPVVAAVSGDATYTATYTATKNSYTITWKQDDGSTIDQTTVEYGAIPAHANPTKPADAQYTYTFSGWSPSVSAVSGDATYTATYTATKNSYTITWKQDDGSTIDQTTAIPSVAGRLL